jgi:HSP20 family protein
MASTPTRYQPSNLTRLPDLVDRLFQESFVLPSAWDRLQNGSRFSIPGNLFETKDGYVMQLGIPGINPESIDIQVTRNQVTIGGKFEWNVAENVNWIWQGMPTGEFRESFTLPAEVEGGKTEASYEHGVLTINLPKAEHLLPKNIKVSVKK